MSPEAGGPLYETIRCVHVPLLGVRVSATSASCAQVGCSELALPKPGLGTSVLCSSAIPVDTMIPPILGFRQESQETKRMDPPSHYCCAHFVLTAIFSKAAHVRYSVRMTFYASLAPSTPDTNDMEHLGAFPLLFRTPHHPASGIRK